MSLLLRSMLRPYLQAPEDDESGGGGGSPSPADRGDTLEEDVDTPDEKLEDKPDDKSASDEDVDEVVDTLKAKAKDDGKPARKPQMIPKARFDEVLQRSKDLERRLNEQSASGDKKQPTVNDKISELETQSAKYMEDYTKALDDGDTKKASELLAKLRANDREVARIEASVTSARDRAVAVEQVRLDMLIDQLEEKYPQLKEGTDEFDEELVSEIQDLRSAFEAKGSSSSDALRKAVKYVLRDAGAGKSVGKDVDEAADEADEAAEDAAKKAAKKAEVDRKAEAVKRNLKAAGRQPADLNKAPGVDSHKKGGGVDLDSVSDMSEEEFAALPDSTRRKLRGDHFSPTA